MRRFVYFFFKFPWLKFKSRWAKYLVMALPIILLVTILTAINTLNTSISHIIDHKILPPIYNYERIISLSQSLGEQDSFFNPNTHEFKQIEQKSDSFTDDEIKDLHKVQNVASVGISRDGVLLAGQSQDLVDNTQVIFNSFVGMSAETAGYLGAEDFSFNPEKEIPVVVGIKALKQYKQTVQANDATNKQKKQELLDNYQKDPTFLKTVWDRNVVTGTVGQSFTINLGSTNWQPVLYQQAGDFENTYAYIPDKVRNQLVSQYTELLNKYWNVNKLMQGTAIKAKVVAIDYQLNPSAISVPNEALPYMHQQLAKHQTNALKAGATIPDSELSTIYKGIAYNDGKLSPEGNYFNNMALPENSTTINSLFIPGLYYRLTKEPTKTLSDLSGNEVEHLAFPIKRVHVAVSDMEYKSGETGVYNSLFAMGYQSGLSTTSNYHNALNFAEMFKSTTEAISLVFMVVALIVSFFLMLRIAKTSDYETGVLRVLGATKDQVLQLYSGIFAQQLVIASLVGIAIGYGLVLTAAPFLADVLMEQNQFQQEHIANTYGIEITVTGADFYHLNIVNLLLDIGFILGVSLIGLLTAALLAARVQPYTLLNNNREA